MQHSVSELGRQASSLRLAWENASTCCIFEECKYMVLFTNAASAFSLLMVSGQCCAWSGGNANLKYNYVEPQVKQQSEPIHYHPLITTVVGALLLHFHFRIFSRAFRSDIFKDMD